MIYEFRSNDLSIFERAQRYDAMVKQHSVMWVIPKRKMHLQSIGSAVTRNS